jgi:hypothetical protein
MENLTAAPNFMQCLVLLHTSQFDNWNCVTEEFKKIHKVPYQSAPKIQGIAEQETVPEPNAESLQPKPF